MTFDIVDFQVFQIGIDTGNPENYFDNVCHPNL